MRQPGPAHVHLTPLMGLIYRWRLARKVLRLVRMRVRGIALLLALALGAMAPAPLSACAMLAGLPGDCQPKPHCEGMVEEQPAARLEARCDMSCCQVTSAPLPQASGTVKKASTPEAGVTLDMPEPLLLPATPFVRAEASPPREISPPERQALLCVFLI